MDMPYFNYGLKPEYRAEVALNCATGLHPRLGTDHYLNHVLGGGLQLAVDVTNDSRFMDTTCPLVIFIPVQNKLDVSLKCF